MLRGLLFSFEGRMRRSQWWVVQLGSYLVAAVGFVVLAMLFGDRAPVHSVTAQIVAGSVMVAGLAAAIWMNLATSIKRFHDQNLSGWFYMISFVPLIGGLVVLGLLGFRDSSRGTNRFGASGKYPDPERMALVFD
jgi:uncharacterized membrane protein YhaH (DUF805 family)